jgi:predicted TPR repeat methyltransferase
MNDINPVDFTLSQAIEAYKSGQTESAQSLFLKILNSDSANPDALYFMSMIDHSAGRTEVAEHRARDLLQQKPADGKALNLLGTLLMGQGKTDEALQHFEKGIRHSDSDPVLRVNAAICHIGLGQPAAAIDECKKAIDLNPDYVNAWNILGNAYMAANDMEQAADSFRTALDKNPGFSNACFNLGMALISLDRLDEAETCFDAILEQAPDHVQALTRKADILLLKNRLEEAGTLLDRAIMGNDSFAPAFVGRGKLFQRLQKHNEALGNFKRAIELNPNSIEALMYAGDSFRKLDQAEAAAAAYSDVLAIDPENAQARFHLAAVQKDAPAPAKPEGDYVRQYFDAFADSFDDSLDKVEYDAPEQLLALARQCLEKSGSDGLDVLDVGCGTGLTGVQFRPLANTLKGIDVSPRMLSLASKRSVYDDLEENDLLGALVRHQGDTDMIVSADTFPYIGDLESVFLAVTSALREKGLFLFTVETHDADDDYLLGQTARYSHSRHYLEQLAERRGLEVLAINDSVYRKESGKDVPGLIVALRKPG